MVLRPHPCRWRRARAAGVAILSACFPFQQSFAFVPCPRQAQHEHRRVSSCRISTSDSSPSTTTGARREQWREAVLPFLPPERFRTVSPADSLGRGEWFKLICGASFEDLPAVRDLALVYTLAGADCIDVAAEEAVIEAARDGVLAALEVAQAIGVAMRAPWLMMSVNDDEEDPHFRKAAFDADHCPPDCPRPCEAVCPADAVVFPDSTAPPAQRAAMVEELLGASAGGGVLGPRCYGCGRCIAVCPPGIIRAEKYKRSPSVVRELLEKVDGVEIHTKGNLERFREVWEGCVAAAASKPRFKVVAVSFPDLGDDTGLAIAAMGAVMLMDGGGPAEDRGAGGDGVVREGPAPEEQDQEEEEEEEEDGGKERERRPEGREEKDGAAAAAVACAPAAAAVGEEREPAGVGMRPAGGRALNVWQTDGRPMSGDTGIGATVACIRLAEKVLDTGALPFGEGQHFVQLAGGTNDRTADKLRTLGLIGGGNSHDSSDNGDGDDGDGDEDDDSKRKDRRERRIRPGGVGGVAYGGYARKAVGRALDRLPAGGAGRVEHYPLVLSAAMEEASLLVGGLKRP